MIVKKPHPRTRTAARITEERQTESDRFEFARRHVIQGRKLSAKATEAFEALHNWKREGRAFHDNDRRPRTPEEREELKTLEATYIDAKARQLIHENDGRLI